MLEMRICKEYNQRARQEYRKEDKEMKVFSNSFKRDYILIAISFFLLGILFLMYPDSSSRILCYTIGGMLCLIGLIKIIEYFKTPVSLTDYSLSLVMGLALIGGGVFVLVKPDILLGVLPTVLGVAVILDGMIKLQNTLDMLRLKDKHWWFTLVVAVVTLGLGATLILNPFKTMALLMQFVGIALIVTGVMDTVALIALSHRLSSLEKERADWMRQLKRNREIEAQQQDTVPED